MTWPERRAPPGRVRRRRCRAGEAARRSWSVEVRDTRLAAARPRWEGPWRGAEECDASIHCEELGVHRGPGASLISGPAKSPGRKSGKGIACPLKPGVVLGTLAGRGCPHRFPAHAPIATRQAAWSRVRGLPGRRLLPLRPFSRRLSRSGGDFSMPSTWTRTSRNDSLLWPRLEPE